MRSVWLAVALALSLLFPVGSFAASPRTPPRSASSHAVSHRSRSHRGAHRTRHGRAKRSKAAKDAFKREHPCPANGRSSGPCPGYVIDHVSPLACGGADDPGNMQWQTVADAKAKDKWERNGCK